MSYKHTTLNLATVISLSISLCSLAHIASQPLSAQQEPAAGQVPGANPLQAALLRWYQADHANASIPFANSPSALAFDGSSMWVSAGSTVIKLRASDGAVLKTILVSAGAGALVFDG